MATKKATPKTITISAKKIAEIDTLVAAFNEFHSQAQAIQSDPNLSPEQKQSGFCSLYAKFKPILQSVAFIFAFKKGLLAAMNAFIAAADSMCPIQPA